MFKLATLILFIIILRKVVCTKLMYIQNVITLAYLMKHGLADQCNIGGCIHLKGDMITIFCISCYCPSLMYSFSSYRFIGESKRYVKNKAE